MLYSFHLVFDGSKPNQSLSPFGISWGPGTENQLSESKEGDRAGRSSLTLWQAQEHGWGG